MEMDERPKPWRMTDVIIFEKPQFISLGINTIISSKAGKKVMTGSVRKSGNEVESGTQENHISSCLSEIKMECDVSECQIMTTNDPLYIPEYSSSDTSNLSVTETTGDINIKIEREDCEDVNVSMAMKENLVGDPHIKTEPEDCTDIDNISSIKNDISFKLEDCVVKEEFEINMENCRSEIQSSNMTKMCDESISTSLSSKCMKRSYHVESDSTGHIAKKKKRGCKYGNQDVKINLPKFSSLEEYILPDIDTADESYSLKQNEECIKQTQIVGVVVKNKGDGICNVFQNYERKREIRKYQNDFSSNSLTNHQSVSNGWNTRKEIQFCNMNSAKSSDNSVNKIESNVQGQKLRRQIISRNQLYRKIRHGKYVKQDADLTKFFSEDVLKNFKLGEEKLGLCAGLKDIINIPGKSFKNEDADLSTVLLWYRIPSDKLAFHQAETSHVCEGACYTERKVVRNCPLCPEQFRTLCSVPYDTHILIHTNYKMYRCPKCPKTYSIMLNLHRHLDTHFKLTYECEDCYEAFDHKCKLLYHQTTHTGYLPFRCRGCGDLFSTNLELTHHRVNSTEEPFKCVICNSTFKWYSLLKLHKKQHEEEKPYLCLFCDNRFTWSAHLYSHLKHTHKLYMSFLWNSQENECHK